MVKEENVENIELKSGKQEGIDGKKDEAENVENIEFKWGKQRGIGGKKRDVQFYESFTYDGVQYSLYDSVYVFKESEPEPYIGKLIKIWKNADTTKKVKILWFFRPCEILKFLGAEVTLDAELFLASGDGVGLANVNPLEAIAGKCNVVCISKDKRNAQPSIEEQRMADFVFYRTFDVEHRKISHDLGDKIAGIDVKLLLNKIDLPKAKDVLLHDQCRKTDGRNAIAKAEATIPPKQTHSKGNVGSEIKLGSTIGGGKDKMANNLELLKGELPSGLRIGSNKTQGKDAKACVLEAEVSAKVRFSKDFEELDHRLLNKAKLDGTPHLVGDKNKRKIPQDSRGIEERHAKKLRLDEKQTKLANGKMPKSPQRVLADEENEIDSREIEVTRMPEPESSKWFKALPWEERMKDAYEKGTLVLIQNLDPTYTSTEIQDIFWHGFKECCTAKMIQRTAFSSPHCGQAYVIFKTKGGAEKAIRMLNEGCLLLSNGRPLVGSFANPCFPSRKPQYFGHLTIDKHRSQIQREMKDAVSTSHCSQPNTVEYEMAMEWSLLQQRTEKAWKSLYKQQGQELKQLKANLKSK